MPVAAPTAKTQRSCGNGSIVSTGSAPPNGASGSKHGRLMHGRPRGSGPGSTLRGLRKTGSPLAMSATCHPTLLPSATVVNNYKLSTARFPRRNRSLVGSPHPQCAWPDNLYTLLSANSPLRSLRHMYPEHSIRTCLEHPRQSPIAVVATLRTFHEGLVAERAVRTGPCP
jgi:hypothetical protein